MRPHLVSDLAAPRSPNACYQQERWQVPQLLSRQSSNLQWQLIALTLSVNAPDNGICVQSLAEPAFESHTTLCRAVPDRTSKLINLLRGQRAPEAEKLSVRRRYNASQHVQQVLKRGWGGGEHDTSSLLVRE